MTTNTELQQHLEAQMRNLKAQIENFSQQIEQSGEQARVELERTADELKARNERTESQLRELQQAGDKVRETLARDMEGHWNAFAQAVNNVFIEPEKNDKRTMAEPQEPFTEIKS